jgi:hypothetical protein
MEEYWRLLPWHPAVDPRHISLCHSYHHPRHSTSEWKAGQKQATALNVLQKKTIHVTTALIRVYKAQHGQLTIPRGRRMYVILLIFNTGATETFDVSVNDPLRYASKE